MPKIKPPTPEEIKQLREYYERMGYHGLPDSTLEKQIPALRIIRQRNNEKA